MYLQIEEFIMYIKQFVFTTFHNGELFEFEIQAAVSSIPTLSLEE